MTQRKKGPGSGKSPGNHSDKRLSFTRPQMSREEIKRVGEEVADLLNSPIFNLAVNSVVDDLGMEILHTEPHETQKREWLYHQGAAVGRMTQKLGVFLQLAQSLHMEELAAEEAAQRDQDAEQGFPAASMN